MSQILIEKVRIKNFRALRKVEVQLSALTLLVGANNSGKTTFLRALNAVLGVSRSMLNKDDLFISQDGTRPENQIIIDIKIIPADDLGQRMPEFSEQWSGVFGAGENIANENEQEYFAFRASFNFQGDDMPEAEYTSITDWDSEQLGVLGEFKRIQQIRNNIRMYFIDAQRDIEDDLRLRTSYFGKMAARISDNFEPTDITALTDLIAQINETAVIKSPALKHLKEALAKLNQTIQTQGAGVDISPFSRSVRDLHKGMKVDFQDHGSERFGMEYHGMGTRSWASILTAGAYIDWELKQIAQKIDNGDDTNLLFPIIALEEPEVHLHPNAQRTLYGQMKDFRGQKIISTHSPYIASQADLDELRHFYKEGDSVTIEQLDMAQLNNKDIGSIKSIIADSKGEVLFSRVVVMGEGPTEEILLTILASAFFGRPCFELGINIMGVGKNYPLVPLLRFLRIKWFVFSDYDTPEVKSDLKSVITKYNLPDENIFKLNDEKTKKPLEEYLFDAGYDTELKFALKAIKEPIYQNDQHRAAKQAEVIAENERIDNLPKDDFLKEFKDWKVKAAHIYGRQILQRQFGKPIFPEKIKELLEKICDSLEVAPNETLL